MSIRNINDTLLLLRVSQQEAAASTALTGYSAEFETAYVSSMGYTNTEVQGLVTLTIESDFPQEVLYGNSLVYHNEALGSTEEATSTPSISVRKSEYSLNYIGSPTRNASPSFSSSSSSETPSSYNEKAAGTEAPSAYMKRAATVSAPIYYENLLDFLIKGGVKVDKETELGQVS